MNIKIQWLVFIGLILGLIIGPYSFWVMGFFVEGAPANIPLDMAFYIVLPLIVFTGLFALVANKESSVKSRVWMTILFAILQAVGFVLYFVFFSLIDG